MAQIAFNFGFNADEGEFAADDLDVDEHGQGSPLTRHDLQDPVDARSHTLDSLVCYFSSLPSRPARCRICCVASRSLGTSTCPELYFVYPLPILPVREAILSLTGAVMQFSSSKNQSGIL